MRYKKIIIAICMVQAIMADAQKQNYPLADFRNPLDIPILLAGNFGECRPNHFHSGIDIKTNGEENLPVYAIADGYVSRIKMEAGGFGHALYITHPNGYTSLYAHLNDFAPAIQRFVKTTQYKTESWTMDVQLTASQFPVKKGQLIAWSGNTGGSTAPHLHLEIRDSKTEHPLNPQLFGFDIKDDIAPLPTQIALYDMRTSIYQQTPQIAKLKKKEGVYMADTILCNAPLAGIGVNVNDYMNGSDNTLTFYTADIYLDSVKQGTITLDDIGYDVTRYLHAHIDYKTKKQTGEWIQLMYQLRGNALDGIYKWTGNKGILDIADKKTHRINIALTDANRNTANIFLYIRAATDTTASICKSNIFKVNEVNQFEHPNVIIKLNDKALYDDVCFGFAAVKDASGYSDRYRLGDVYVPVHSYFDISIKPNKAIPFALKDKIALVYSDGKDETGKAAMLDNGWYKASVRNMGEYRLVADTTAPVIKPMQKQNAILSKAKRMSFTIKDNITSVKKYRGELDGKWICIEQHGSQYFYTFDEHCPKGKHTLVLTATDENGNTSKLIYNFSR
ncbi:hypothetical protein CAP35_04905 [Chitinophagaceae bacterium IBVUCB1]|nr:hypothetical protein CAP35_04905 [Chitinophagaceae bacterium IBVUCB1]